ncbi:hypothetical protein FXO37_00787 [Capsicum annuum]|nr:hypothetical protein FXO37_00787 [Capsicum annuum]
MPSSLTIPLIFAFLDRSLKRLTLSFSVFKRNLLNFSSRVSLSARSSSLVSVLVVRVLRESSNKLSRDPIESKRIDKQNRRPTKVENRNVVNHTEIKSKGRTLRIPDEVNQRGSSLMD